MKINIWKIRTNKNISVKTIAEITGLGKTTLYNIENEKVSPTLFELELISKALDVRITDLFDCNNK